MRLPTRLTTRALSDPDQPSRSRSIRPPTQEFSITCTNDHESSTPCTRQPLHTTSEASTPTSLRRDVVFIRDGWRVVVLIRNGCCRRTRSTSTRRTNRTHRLQNIRREPLLRRCGRNCRHNIRRTGLRARRKNWRVYQRTRLRAYRCKLRSNKHRRGHRACSRELWSNHGPSRGPVPLPCHFRRNPRLQTPRYSAPFQ